MGYIGENIKTERVRAGLDQASLAASLGLDQTAISRFENGSRRPSVDLLKKIARVLGCDFAALTKEGGDVAPDGVSPEMGDAERGYASDARGFVMSLLRKNPEIGIQLRSLSAHRDELTEDDWQLIAGHLTFALDLVEHGIDLSNKLK